MHPFRSGLLKSGKPLSLNRLAVMPDWGATGCCIKGRLCLGTLLDGTMRVFGFPVMNSGTFCGDLEVQVNRVHGARTEMTTLLALSTHHHRRLLFLLETHQSTAVRFVSLSAKVNSTCNSVARAVTRYSPIRPRLNSIFASRRKGPPKFSSTQYGALLREPQPGTRRNFCGGESVNWGQIE